MKAKGKRREGRPTLRAFVAPEDAEELQTNNFERTKQLDAVVQVKVLQAAGKKHDVALAIVARAIPTSVRQLQRWHARFGSVAAAEARRELQAATPVAEGTRFLSAWTVLPIELQRLAEQHRTPSSTIAEAVEAELSAADAARVPVSAWMAKESTRQKLAKLFRTT